MSDVEVSDNGSAAVVSGEVVLAVETVACVAG